MKSQHIRDGTAPRNPARGKMPGLRDRNKAEKKRRILSAARHLFSKHGFEQTTMRAIALRAGVALGTISLYAEDKRDLIKLIFTEEIAGMIRDLSVVPDSTNQLDRLVAFFSPFYHRYCEDPELYALFVRENTFGSQSRHGILHRRNLLALIDRVRDWLDAQKASGEVRSDMDTSVAARLIFFVYFASVRWWMASGQPDLRQGIADLRALLSLTLEGLRPHSVKRRSVKRKRKA